jgi:hyperosmotically inducible protein
MASTITVLLLVGIGAVPVSAQYSRGVVKTIKASDSNSYHTWLEKQIRHEVLILPYYGVYDNLAFKIDGDRVILLGQVVRSSTRTDAAMRVKKIEGVTSVVNQIEVLPASAMDDYLRRRIFRAIYSSPFLEHYAIQPVPPIHIMVKNGRVTLEGVVASEAEKNVANIKASGVAGAFSVTNRLRVEK